VRWFQSQLYRTPMKRMQIRGAELIDETGRPPEEADFLGGDGADAQSGYPDHLPGEEVKRAGVLQKNLQGSDVNDHIVNPRTQAELRKQPDSWCRLCGQRRLHFH
jgi:hypothetical protein